LVSPYYYQIEGVAALGLSVRFGVNLAELADFLVGFAGVDLLNDDIAEWESFMRRRASEAATGNTVRLMGLEVEDFRKSKGRYPQSLEEVKSSCGIEGANDEVNARFSDAWGHPLRYVVVNPRLNVGAFDLYSLGANGNDEYDRPDFGDDIHWEKDHVRLPPVKQE
jgi:hypothetical protein